MGAVGQSVTLANSIIGVGILAMPFCFQQCGVVLATLMLVVSGMVSRLSCHFLLKSAIIARRRNFEFLAFHIFGSLGKLAVEIGIIGFLMGTCIAYFVVVGDLGPQIIAKMFNINQSDVLRTSVMVIVSLACVLPLGLLRNVDSLSNVSAATIGFYICLVLKIVTEAAGQMFTSEWQTKIELWKPAGVLQCVPIFSMALFCQTQLFEIFESLPMLSLEKMNEVTKNALNICSVVYILVGLFGYIAFCSQTISGNILVSLSPTMASDVIKLGFVMSLAFSFPLIIFPCRASLYSLLYKKELPSHHDHIINHSIPEGTFRCITVAIIAITLLISLMIPNIETVLGLVGSTIGVVICVVFPAACFISVTFKNTSERLLAKIVLTLGIIVMVLGTYANLEAAESSHPSYYDERQITPERIDKIVQEFVESQKHLEFSAGGIQQPDLETNKGKDANISPEIKDSKDSEIQPPNPVPPEAQSSENHEPVLKINPKHEPSKAKSKEEFHEEEGAGDKEAKINNNEANKKIHENVSPEKPKVSEKAKETLVNKVNQDNQDKIDIIKHKALMETIKQHEEEQKELMKEQKEILDGIKKTKMELEKNKKDQIDKIALESIQKIADIAIQSINAVTVKPVDVIPESDKKISPEIVKQVAEKVIESIVEKTDNKKILQNDISKVAPNVKIDTPEIATVVQKPIDNNQVPIGNVQSSNPIQSQSIQNQLKPLVPIESVHQHSPDEPKSYIRGEEQENNKQNVLETDSNLNKQPLIITMSQNALNTQELNNAKVINEKAQKNNAPNKLEDSLVNSEHLRVKREVTDCSKDEINDKISGQFDLQDLPSKVDLGNLQNNLVSGSLIHSRSLKSVQDESDKR